MRLYPRETGAVAMVVTEAECAAQARVDLPAEVPQLLFYARAAQAWVEQMIAAPLTPRALVARADVWPETGSIGGWWLWMQQVTAVTAIDYLDAAGQPQSLPAEWRLVERGGVSQLRWPAEYAFPELLPNSEISISLTAGYPLNGCNELLRAAVLGAMTDMYDNRSTAISAPVQDAMRHLLRPFCLPGLA